MEIYLICVIVGMFIGGLMTYLIIKKSNKPFGAFVIDVSDPMKDVFRFEAYESLESIYSKKQIILTVKTYGDFTLN